MKCLIKIYVTSLFVIFITSCVKTNVDYDECYCEYDGTVYELDPNKINNCHDVGGITTCII